MACYSEPMTVEERAETEAETARAPGWRRRLVLWTLLVAAVLLMTGTDSARRPPAATVGSPYVFSVFWWEVANVPDKWTNLLRETVFGGRPPREERRADLEEYLKTARLARKEERRLDGRLVRGVSHAGSVEELEKAREYLRELLETKRRLRPSAEEAVEAELDRVVKDEGLAWPGGITFPPIDFRFEQPPTLLVTSRRDRLRVLEAVLLEPDMDVLVRDELEKRLFDWYGVSALVDNLAGLATYPLLVSDLYPLRDLLRVAAHEWLHAYFLFRPLGRNIYTSEAMFSLNETIADVAGRELGDTAFARMGGDLSENASRYLAPEQRDPVFTREMRETRETVEELLADGKVEEAEEYMKRRWWDFRLGGYGLRKLNQAYFAFRGRYAESPASVSPIGREVNEMRGYHHDVGSFIKTVAKLSSYEEFLDELGRFRSLAAAERAG